MRYLNSRKLLTPTSLVPQSFPSLSLPIKLKLHFFETKSAYPVYITIGNLPKSIRRKPSRQGQNSFGLPSNLAATTRHKQSIASAVSKQIYFTRVCGIFLLPLQAAGIHGVQAVDGHGLTRRAHPILAVYVGDYPEQILVTGAITGDCPLCQCPNGNLGDYPCMHQMRDLGTIHDALDHLGDPEYPQLCRDARIKPIQHPFWQDLPYTNIFQCITPDVLHQLHQGVVKHLLAWIISACGASVIDERVRRLPPNHSIHLFRKGISTMSRVSGTEHRQNQ